MRPILTAQNNDRPPGNQPGSVIQIKTAISLKAQMNRVSPAEIAVPRRTHLDFRVISQPTYSPCKPDALRCHPFQLSTVRRLLPQQRNYFPAQLHYALQRAGWHADDFLEQPRHRRQE